MPPPYGGGVITTYRQTTYCDLCPVGKLVYSAYIVTYLFRQDKIGIVLDIIIDDIC